MGFDNANNISYLVGYFDRDYGKSALFADKNVVIDASNLPDGITVNWQGADSARVLAVSGDLALTNVAITGGNSVFDVAADVGQHPDDNQTSTLARGAGLAVWGVANLTDCTIYDNHAVGDDADTSRDGGAYGGGGYADTVVMDNCIVSGNTVYGGGAAGGGVFSVGGRDTRIDVSSISQSAITENRIAGLFAYGGGVYSDGGGIGLSTRIHIDNSTIARNLVEPPALPPFLIDLLEVDERVKSLASGKASADDIRRMALKGLEIIGDDISQRKMKEYLSRNKNFFTSDLKLGATAKGILSKMASKK